MSFGREIKDFIAAFQAGDKIFGSADDREYKKLRNQYMKAKIADSSDPETLALKKERLKASTGLARARMQRALRGPDPDLTESRRLNNELRREQLKFYRNPPKTDYGISPMEGAPSQAPGPQSAIEAEDPYNTADMGGEYDTADLGGEYAPQEDFEFAAARGGAIGYPQGNSGRFTDKLKGVKKFADGGIVSDDDEDDYSEAADAADDDEDDAEDYAQPAAEAAPAAPAQAAGYSKQAALDAARAGVQYAKEHLGADETVDMSAQSRGAGPGGRAAYLRGAGAASGNEMDEIRNAIDPQRKMSESERNMAALAHAWEWKLRQGDEAGAQRIAGSMVQYYRVMSERYKAISQVAAENGDVNTALKAIVKSYANTPDGVELKLAQDPESGKLSYSFVDADGKTVEKGVASPDQILEFASKSSMHNFDDLLTKSAGTKGELAARAAAEKAKGGAKPMKMNERVAADKQIDTAYDEQLTAMTPEGGEAPKVAGADALAFKSAANSIYTDKRNNVSKTDAMGAAFQLTAVDPKNPDGPGSAPFKAELDENGAKVSFPNGTSMFVPKDQFDRLAIIRGRKVAAAKKAMGEKSASDEKFNARVKKVKDAVGDVVSPIYESAKRGYEKGTNYRRKQQAIYAPDDI